MGHLHYLAGGCGDRCGAACEDPGRLLPPGLVAVVRSVTRQPAQPLTAALCRASIRLWATPLIVGMEITERMDGEVLSQPAPAASVRLSYGPDPLQFGDLRVPTGGEPYPVAVVIHGGFWKALYGLDHMAPLCADFAARGVATWNIEYHRIGHAGGGWPGTCEDVARAVDHLRELAGTYHLDLDRVMTLGFSAGGHLALWAAGRHRIPASDPLHSETGLLPRGAVSLAGVCDLRRAWEMRLSNGIVETFMGGAPGQVPERYAAASPAEMLPLGVRQVLVHGTADEEVPFTISEEYHATARARGDDATLVTLPNTPHFALIDPHAREWPQVMQMVLPLVGLTAR